MAHPRSHTCIGILAHVDAGKTTLSESLLYVSGNIRKLGRVDNRDAFLDTFYLERARGITIFSKQAELKLPGMDITLLDTPGHVDFSAEMERTLSVLDYAILVISGADGVQGHTRTLWKLLERYGVPTFLFINKMDQNGTDKEALLAELKEKLSGNCIDFTDTQSEEFFDEIAMCEEDLMEQFLETGSVEKDDICAGIAERSIFPCFFGSALKLVGIEEFIAGIREYTIDKEWPAQFGARVFKITRDEQKARLTYMRITGGSLRVKDLIRETGEKINQIRIYSGTKFEAVPEVHAGDVCAVTGLTGTKAGEGLGISSGADEPMLEPVLSYDMILPYGEDVHQTLIKLRELEEEQPELHIVWNEQLGKIQARLMGPVQVEILKTLIAERFGMEVEFGEGSIVYKETINSAVEGVGHYEPLRHYAEVHLLLEPGERGSGIVLSSACREEDLDRNWQRLILTHLAEKQHKGVITGSPITDIKITVIAGRAHLKHTEGGDFREATYRAVRHGLMQAESMILEPYYDFRLELPQESVGRALMDLEKLYAKFSTPELEGNMSVITGSGPVATLQNYQAEVTSYTRGRGHFQCSLKGYDRCHNSEDVWASFGYDPEYDMENPAGSVFCSHGAGFYVDWLEVVNYMHIDSGYGLLDVQTEEEKLEVRTSHYKGYVADQKELDEIFERTYGPIKRRIGDWDASMRSVGTPAKEKEFVWKKKKVEKEYLLVDGYNVLFSWPELNELSQTSIDAARSKLMDILSNYQGYKHCELILVFDAYRVEGHVCEIFRHHNIYVVYTKEAETADQYIEKTAHELGRKHKVTVATSDGIEQVIIRGQGCILMSSRELQEEIARVNREIRNEHLEQVNFTGPRLFDNISDEMREHLEDVRMGRADFGKKE